MMTMKLFREALSRRRRLVISGLALVLSGCAVGPDFHRPDAPAVTAYTPTPLTADAQFAEGGDIQAQWWTVFQSPALNALVAEALKANPDLAAAKAALKSAQETYYAQRGALLPEIDAGYNVTRERASSALSPPLNSSQELFTLHTAQLNINYTLDVFGGLRRQTEQAKAQAEQQRFEAEAAYLSLTANVVNAAIQEAALRDQVEATRRTIDAERRILDVMRRQLDLGQIARADVAAQEAAVALAEQNLPPLEKQWAQQRDLLADLTGHFPSEAPAERVDLATLTLPADLPLSLPSKLVEQRPDIRAAEANLHAASAGVGVAIANRLPNITLSANGGGAATTLATLFSNGDGFWTLTGGVAQPIFQGGALLHRQKAAEAALDQARDQYRSAVLSAFQNVADTLQGLQADARDLAAATTAKDSAAESLTIAKRQLELGQVGGISVLSAEQTYQTANAAFIQARANRYSDVAALFQALGGGWWNRGAL
jgi:NodT family efflux transporter outer membrane factor (OMF) lipoprotein